MTAREDLLFVAASLAGSARGAADSGKPITYESTRIAGLAQGAKAALEAAQLVDAEPAPIIAAAERLDHKLAVLGIESGVELALQFGPVEAIDAVTELVYGLTVIARGNVALSTAYQRLHELCERLETDFTASDTETSKRIAARIHAAVEEAEQAIGYAKRGEG